MNRISSGLLLLLGAGFLGVLWARGYLADYVATASGRIGGSSTILDPITVPLAGRAGGPIRTALPELPVIQPVWSVA